MRLLIRTLTLAACLAAVALPAGAQTATDPWPMAGGGPAHEGVTDGPEPPYATAWRAGIDAEPIAGPVVGEGILVVMARDEVVALDPATGEELWRADRERGPAGPAAIAGELVLHVDGEDADASLVARDRASGEEVWRRELEASAAGGITVEGPQIWLATRDGGLHRFHVRRGTPSMGRSGLGRVDGSVAAVGGIAYLTSQDLDERTGRVVAIRDAQEAWSFRPDGNVVGFSAVTVSDGVAYVGTGDGFARALDAESGERLWATRLRAPFGAALSPALAGEGVVVSDVLGHVYVLDRETGQERWLHRIPGLVTAGSPVVVGEHVVIGDDSGQVSALDVATGHLVWRRALGDQPVGTLAADGDRLYAAPVDGPVTAFAHDPGGMLLDEPSPTTLFLGTALLNFAAAFAGVLLGVLLLFRVLLKPREED